jgi:hypothetical protein
MVVMPIVRENEFAMISEREYWVTSEGRKMFPHEFEDAHLQNTIQLLHRKCRQHRLEQAKQQALAFYRMGHDNFPPEQFYRYFKKEVDNFLNLELSDLDWLKDNSKIYTLLIEEAKYRGIDISPHSNTSKHSVTLEPKKAKRFKYSISTPTSTASPSLWA